MGLVGVTSDVATENECFSGHTLAWNTPTGKAQTPQRFRIPIENEVRDFLEVLAARRRVAREEAERKWCLIDPEELAICRQSPAFQRKAEQTLECGGDIDTLVCLHLSQREMDEWRERGHPVSVGKHEGAWDGRVKAEDLEDSSLIWLDVKVEANNVEAIKRERRA